MTFTRTHNIHKAIPQFNNATNNSPDTKITSEEYFLFLNTKYHSFFFFQAEDGIRDADVTGVQTCALPISGPGARLERRRRGHVRVSGERGGRPRHGRADRPARAAHRASPRPGAISGDGGGRAPRPAARANRDEIGRA